MTAVPTISAAQSEYRHIIVIRIEYPKESALSWHNAGLSEVRYIFVSSTPVSVKIHRHAGGIVIKQ